MWPKQYNYSLHLKFVKMATYIKNKLKWVNPKRNNYGKTKQSMIESWSNHLQTWSNYLWTHLKSWLNIVWTIFEACLKLWTRFEDVFTIFGDDSIVVRRWFNHGLNHDRTMTKSWSNHDRTVIEHDQTIFKLSSNHLWIMMKPCANMFKHCLKLIWNFEHSLKMVQSFFNHVQRWLFLDESSMIRR